MIRVKFNGFDTDKLLQDITQNVEKDLKKNPEKVLNSHIGDVIEGKCTKCGETTIEILSSGKARCTKCGLISKVGLNIRYK